MTVLEAKVNKTKWQNLKAAYATKTKKIPPEILESFLIQDDRNPETWQIITFWHSKEELQTMRQSGQKPVGVAIFNEVGVSPKLSVFNIALSAKH